MIDHEKHETYESWRRIIKASFFVKRRPATLRVPAMRREALRRTLLGETGFPHKVLLGLADRLGSAFGSTKSLN